MSAGDDLVCIVVIERVRAQTVCLSDSVSVRQRVRHCVLRRADAGSLTGDPVIGRRSDVARVGA